MNSTISHEQLSVVSQAAYLLGNPAEDTGRWVNRGAYPLGEYSIADLYNAMVPNGTGKIYTIMSTFTPEGIKRTHDGEIRNAKSGSNEVLDELDRYHDDYLVRKLGGLPINFIRSIASLQTISSNTRNQVPHTDSLLGNTVLFALQAFPDNTETLADGVSFEGEPKDVIDESNNNLREAFREQAEYQFERHGDQAVLLGYHSTIHREPPHDAHLVGQPRLLIRTSIRLQ